jgi:hypothetical protein
MIGVFSEMKKIALPLPEDHSVTVRTLHTKISTQQSVAHSNHFSIRKKDLSTLYTGG